VSTKSKFCSCLLLGLVGWLPFSIQAENAQDFGDYVVHHNAFTTDSLTPEVAKAYNITRSKNRAMLNVVVLKKVMDTTGEPVAAQASATATNLNAQMRMLKLREIRKDTAIYYIADFNVSDGEILDFVVNIEPEGASKPYTVKFRQQFFTR